MKLIVTSSNAYVVDKEDAATLHFAGSRSAQKLDDLLHRHKIGFVDGDDVFISCVWLRSQGAGLHWQIAIDQILQRAEAHNDFDGLFMKLRSSEGARV
jgi:hypothetical protein